jgi:hypothetical protein
MRTLIERRSFLLPFLRAIGYNTDKDILNLFGLAEEIKVSKKTLKTTKEESLPPGF